MSINKPLVLVFAGPNGSGKSTITRALSVVGTYVNADDLKTEYNLSDLEATQKAESLRNKLLEKGFDFTFETVMSTDRNMQLLEKARNQGYEVHCIYVLTCDENINVARVRSRYASGGHNVPDDKIRIRYRRSLDLLPKLIDICDKILVYDNTDIPILVAKKDSTGVKIFANQYWSQKDLEKLVGISQKKI